MRVIAGKYKGRKLYAPEGYDIRPTSDKVKEAVFSMLGPYIEGAEVIDLFAGTGSMGIEALSRGAASCLFCDVSPKSIALIKSNLKTVGTGQEAIVFAGDFRRVLQHIEGSGANVRHRNSAISEDPPEDSAEDFREGRKRRIIFADPPYDSEYYDVLMQTVHRCGIITECDLIILESDTHVPPGDYAGFEKIKSKKYGRTGIDIYSKK